MRTGIEVGAIVLSLAALQASPTLATPDLATPPQGYIRIDQTMLPTGSDRIRDGLSSVDFSLVLDQKALATRGTFWATQFTFSNSSQELPTNHEGGPQGGYIGLQTKLDGSKQAIVSIWWATQATAGAGAECVSSVEAWYRDEKPFDPPIAEVTMSDPARKMAGIGNFISGFNPKI